MSVDPATDDTGDDDSSYANIGTTVTATYPESVQIGTMSLPVISGLVDISGIAYSVPVVTMPTATSLGSNSVTVFPTYVGPSYSITVTYLHVVIVSEPPVSTTYGVKPTTSPPPPASTCTATMEGVNSEGGGGPGSAPIDYTKFGLTITGGGVVYSEFLDDTGKYSGYSVACSAFGCFNGNAAAFSGTWNFINNSWLSCSVQDGSQSVDGNILPPVISSGTVSTTTDDCVMVFNC